MLQLLNILYCPVWLSFEKGNKFFQHFCCACSSVVNIEFLDHQQKTYYFVLILASLHHQPFCELLIWASFDIWLLELRFSNSLSIFFSLTLNLSSLIDVICYFSSINRNFLKKLLVVFSPIFSFCFLDNFHKTPWSFLLISLIFLCI